MILVFVLTQTITFTLSGRLSDIFGRRYMFLVSNALAFVGYMVCSRAHSVPVLIGGVRFLLPPEHETCLILLLEHYRRLRDRRTTDNADSIRRTRA